MGITPAVKGSSIIFDGKIPFFVNTGLQSWDTGAVSNAGMTVAPCDGTIVGAYAGIVVAATSAAALLNVGVNGDPDSHLDGLSFENVGAGLWDIIDETWVSKEISKGDRISVQLEAATAVGSLAVTLVVAPR